MGCDIHFVVERKLDGKWVGVYSAGLTPHFSQKGNTDRFERYPAFKSRNYRFFAVLAGVRGDGPDPKGVPQDVSELARIEIAQWDSDGHSHSWDPLKTFLAKWLSVNSPAEYNELAAALLKGEEYGPLIDLAGVWDHSEIEEMRVVYWFDN